MSIQDYDKVLLELANLRQDFWNIFTSQFSASGPSQEKHLSDPSQQQSTSNHPTENQAIILIESDDEHEDTKNEQYLNVTIPLKAEILSTPGKGGSSVKSSLIKKKVIQKRTRKAGVMKTRSQLSINRKLFPAKEIGKKALRATKHNINDLSIKTRLRGSLKKDK